MLVWIFFLIFIFILLALDLGVFHRHAHVVSVREALKWTFVWILTALAFAGFVLLRLRESLARIGAGAGRRRSQRRLP